MRKVLLMSREKRGSPGALENNDTSPRVKPRSLRSRLKHIMQIRLATEPSRK